MDMQKLALGLASSLTKFVSWILELRFLRRNGERFSAAGKGVNPRCEGITSTAVSGRRK
jgi:hypothetical protein